MRDPAYLIQAALWTAGCAWAAVVGRGPARAAAALLFVQLVIEYLAWRFLPGLKTRPIAAVSEVLLAGYFAWVAFRYRLRWAAASAGAQVMAIAIYVAQPYTPRAGTWALVTAADLFGIILMVTVVIGAWGSRGRRSV